MAEKAHLLDGVIIATPHATHYDVARQVIEKQGIEKPLHILLEKPMSTDIQDA